MKIIKKLIVSCLKILFFIGGWIISMIDIILPYRLRVVYRDILGFFAKLLMRFNIVWEFTDQYTFASEEERDLSKKKSLKNELKK